jgi:hypothetical protein
MSNKTMKYELTTKQRAVLDGVVSLSPEKFGVRAIYYRPIKNGLQLLFVIKKESRSSLINYLNSLADNLAEVKNIPIRSNVYFSNNQIAKDIIEDNSLAKIVAPKVLPLFA